MKKIQKFVMAFLLGAMTLGFSACSDDNGGDEKFELPEIGQATTTINSSDKDMEKVTKNYVQTSCTPHTRLLPPTHALSTALLRPSIRLQRLAL